MPIVTHSPVEFINNWNRFTKGLGERPLPPLGGEEIDVIFEYGGETYYGLPLDPRRVAPGYLRLDDHVFFWGHAVETDSFEGQPFEPMDWVADLVVDYSGRPARWLEHCDDERHNWADEMSWGVHRLTGIDNRYVYCEDESDCSYCSTCCALPLEVHLERARELNLPNSFRRCDLDAARIPRYWAAW